METEILFTFAATSAAIRAERLLLDAGLPVKVMSLPSAIRAGCGICLRVPPPDAARAQTILAEGDITDAALYTRTVEDGQSRYEPHPAKET